MAQFSINKWLKFSLRNTFVEVRGKLVNEMNNISSEQWLEEFEIGQTQLTVYTYFKGMMDHDIHHFNQIFMKLEQSEVS